MQLFTPISAKLEINQMPTRKTTTPKAQVSTTPSSKKEMPVIKEIKILGVGRADDGEPYVKMVVGDPQMSNASKSTSTFLVRANDFLDDPKAQYKRLQNRGANLMKEAARKSLRDGIDAALNGPEAFTVATRVGWHEGAFVSPDEVIGVPLEARDGDGVEGKRLPVEIYLDEDRSAVYQRYQRNGHPREAIKLFKLFRGNTRLMLAAAHAFVGPLSVLINFEHVGIQFYGPRGLGKSSLGAIVSSIWGWDPDHRHVSGFGVSWKVTENAYEKYGAGYNDTWLFLDETHAAPGRNRREKADVVLNAIKDISGGQGKARFTDPTLGRFFLPLCSTSNTSVVEMLALTGQHDEASYYDRLFDIPPPRCIQAGRGDGYFEDLHGRKDKVEFRNDLIALAKTNHGLAARAFIRRLNAAVSKDRAELVVFVETHRREYLRAAEKIKAPERDPGRLHGKFATIYAAGCVAIRFNILPFKSVGLLDAILACEQDHVEFVRQELLRFSAPGSVGARLSAANIGRPARFGKSPYKSLRAHLHGPARRKLIDFRSPKAMLPKGHVHATAPGYITRHDQEDEFLLSNERFELEAGGVAEGKSLKRMLDRMGLIKSDGVGRNKRFSVKRDIPGIGRVRVVALRMRVPAR